MCSRNSTGKRSSSWPKRCAMAGWLSQLARNCHSVTRPRLKQRQKRVVSGRSCWWLDIVLRTNGTRGKSGNEKRLGVTNGRCLDRYVVAEDSSNIIEAAFFVSHGDQSSASVRGDITLIVPGSIIYRTTDSRGRKWPAIESLLKQMGLRSNSTDF